MTDGTIQKAAPTRPRGRPASESPPAFHHRTVVRTPAGPRYPESLVRRLSGAPAMRPYTPTKETQINQRRAAEVQPRMLSITHRDGQ